MTGELVVGAVVAGFALWVLATLLHVGVRSRFAGAQVFEPLEFGEADDPGDMSIDSHWAPGVLSGPRTPEEKVAFRKEWDARVEAALRK